MSHFIRNTLAAGVATVAIATGLVALPVQQAEAGGGGGAAAAGVIGFATGAIVGGALSQPRTVTVYEEPAYYRGGRPAPWSPAWYSYCDARYRSFNPDTGMYLGYDGRHHFCR
ncbi:BA14K family protein [Amorphus sp. 3PC139-8]